MFLQAEVAGISADRILSVAAIVLSPASAVFAAWLVNRNRDRRVVDRDDFKVHREAFESRIAQCERERDHWIARARDAGQENEALRRLATEAAVRQEREDGERDLRERGLLSEIVEAQREIRELHLRIGHTRPRGPHRPEGG
jgi:hypothetical protein